MQRDVPRQGDFVELSFDPQSGHEQMGRRPALVVSKDAFNNATGLVICCPVTNTRRGSRFHAPVPLESQLTGFVMREQVKSVDFASRRATFIAKAPIELVEEVLSILDACLYPTAGRLDPHPRFPVDHRCQALDFCAHVRAQFHSDDEAVSRHAAGAGGGRAAAVPAGRFLRAVF